MNLFECSKNLLINVHNLEKSNNFLVFFLLLFLITGNIKKKKKNRAWIRFCNSFVLRARNCENSSHIEYLSHGR